MKEKISFHGTIQNYRSFLVTSRTDQAFKWNLNMDLCLNEGQKAFRFSQPTVFSFTPSPSVLGQDIILVLSYIGAEKMQMPMEFHFIFKNSDGKVIWSQKEIKTDFGVTKKLTRCFKKSEFPYTPSLSFQVDVHRYKEDLSPSVSATVPQKMLNLLSSKKHSDFIIRVEGTEIPVHRCILANSSTVFEAMLRSGMSETETGRVEINNLTLATVQEMLKFMYSGLVEQPTVPLALELLKASDIYDMDDLRGWCHQYLKECLDWNNVLGVLVSAHDFNNSKLKDTCLNFLIRNRQKIDPTADFQGVLKERCDLAIEIMVKMWK